jgi:hypothetical protein
MIIDGHPVFDKAGKMSSAQVQIAQDGDFARKTGDHQAQTTPIYGISTKIFQQKLLNINLAGYQNIRISSACKFSKTKRAAPLVLVQLKAGMA